MATHAPITVAPFGTTTFEPHRGTRYRRLLATLSPHEIGYAIEALIARMDALQGDVDLEPDDDRCAAGDDHMISGPVANANGWYYSRYNYPGDDTDGECALSPIQHQFDQTRPLLKPLDQADDRGRSEFAT